MNADPQPWTFINHLIHFIQSINTFRFKIIQPPKKPKIPELPREKQQRGREDDGASMPPPPSPASSTVSDGSLSTPVGGPAAAGVPSPAPARRHKRSAPKVGEIRMLFVQFRIS